MSSSNNLYSSAAAGASDEYWPPPVTSTPPVPPVVVATPADPPPSSRLRRRGAHRTRHSPILREEESSGGGGGGEEDPGGSRGDPRLFLASVGEAHAQRLLRSRAAAGAWLNSQMARDLGQCYFCTHGSRSYDSSGLGSRFHAELMVLMNKFLPTMNVVALTEMALRFHEERMRPEYESAGIPLPPMSREATFEHFNTSEHTLNPRMMQVVLLRHLLQTLQCTSASSYLPNGETDLRAVEIQAKLVGMIMKLYTLDTSKLAFNETVDGDVQPDVTARLAPGAVLETLEKELMPGNLQWLKDHLEGAAAAEAEEPDPMEEDEGEAAIASLPTLQGLLVQHHLV